MKFPFTVAAADIDRRLAQLEQPAAARQLERLTQECQAEHPHLTPEQAFTLTLNRHPELYAQLEARPTGVTVSPALRRAAEEAAAADPTLTEEGAITLALSTFPELYALDTYPKAAAYGSLTARTNVPHASIPPEVQRALDVEIAVDPTATYEQAYARALKKNPKLYDLVEQWDSNASTWREDPTGSRR